MDGFEEPSDFGVAGKFFEKSGRGGRGLVELPSAQKISSFGEALKAAVLRLILVNGLEKPRDLGVSGKFFEEGRQGGGRLVELPAIQEVSGFVEALQTALVRLILMDGFEKLRN